MLELLIVVAIISIGLAVALPKIQTQGRRQRVDRMAITVAADLRSAFTAAARARVPVRVSIPGDTIGYALINKVTGDSIVRRRFGGGDVKVTGKSGGAMTLDVFPNGVSSGTDTILVKAMRSATAYTRKVSVSRVGFVRVIP